MIDQPPVAIEAHVHGCRTTACDRRIHRRRRRHWLLRFPLRSANSTSYCPGSSGSITADGSVVSVGTVAMNILPLETQIRFEHPVMGRHYFRVRDRIGWGSDLDIWAPSCSWSAWWGRRTVGYRVIA
jgi:hypothetical protein